MKKKPFSEATNDVAKGNAFFHPNSDPATCVKWSACNAPVCPIDPEWGKRVLHPEDPVCFYMTEAVKTGAQARFEQAGKEELFKAVSGLLDSMSLRWGRIRRTLERATGTGSRMTVMPPSRGKEKLAQGNPAPTKNSMEES